jgi:hypothetical protein
MPATATRPPAKRCAHCRRVTRKVARRLCDGCHRDPALRARYPLVWVPKPRRAAETVVLAVYQLWLENPEEPWVTEGAVAVRAWRIDPARFGIKGLPDGVSFPDNNRVRCELCHKLSVVRKLGWLARHADKSGRVRLTEAGLAKAKELAGRAAS